MMLYSLGLIALGGIILYVLSFVQHALMMLCAATLLAYLLAPLVIIFNNPITLLIPRSWDAARGRDRTPEAFVRIPVLRRGLSWMTSLMLVFFSTVTLLVLVLSFVVPILMRELHSFAEQGIPTIQAQWRNWLGAFQQVLLTYLPSEAQEMLPTYFNSMGSEIGHWVSAQLYKIAPIVGRFAGTVATMFLVPIMTFYLLMDIHRLKSGFMALFPRGRRSEVQALVNKVDWVLGHFIRGQLLVALIIGLSIAAVLHIIGVPYALAIGLFAGVLNMIPYIGAPAGFVPAVLMAAVVGGTSMVLMVIISMYCVHLFEGKVVVPTIVGKSVGLPPVVIIFSLIAGAEIGGVIGMLLAVPTAGIVRVFALHYVEKRNKDEQRDLRLPRGDPHAVMEERPAPVAAEAR